MKPIITILLLLLFYESKAQTCNGSVGDPIVNNTFGSGPSTIGPPLPSGTTTNLIFRDSVCPGDGEYAITSRTGLCYANTWHTINDHPGNGYFMLVNASEQPSTFYVQQIDNLCAGTTFQFAVWIANLCNFTNSVRPNITLTIEDTNNKVLGSYSTGDIPVNTQKPEWKQYGFNFTLPVGVSSVVLRMYNSSRGGIDNPGNDFGLDDITFRPIGPAVSLSTQDFTGDTTLLCSTENKSLQFLATVDQCYSNTSYQWQVSTDNSVTWSDIQGATSSVYNRGNTPPGTYSYRLTAAQSGNIGSTLCRVVSKSFTVIVYDPGSRTVNIKKSDSLVCEGTSVRFEAHTTFAGTTPSFQWMINNRNVGTNDSSFTTAVLATEDRVSCILTPSLSCNSPVISDGVSVIVLKKARTAINQFICEGESYEGYTASGTYNDSFAGSNGCDSIRTLTLVVYPKQHSTFDTTICFGTSYLEHNQAGSYTYTYTDVHGCDSIHTVILRVLPDINAKPYTDTILCSGDTLTLSPGVYDAYLWQDGSTGSMYPVTYSGAYKVTVTNKCGTATKTTRVQEKVCIVAFPTAFSPNGDGRNDLFRVVNAYNLSRYHCVVFNRWGQRIFETTDPYKGWTGAINAKQAEIGTYIWWCEYQRKGETQPVQLKGTVVLMR